MSANVTALLVAIAGVLGTLIAPVLTQRLSFRARQQEIEAQRQQRAEERVEEQRHTAFNDRRACCIALNTAARGFRRAIKNCLFDGLDKMGAELEQARQVFTDQYSEAQIILPDAVTKAARPVYGTLSEAYGWVKAIAVQVPGDMTQPGSQKLVKYLDQEVDGEIRQLRKVMRRDLGISDLPVS
jgi:hypothetical protein